MTMLEEQGRALTNRVARCKETSRMLQTITAETSLKSSTSRIKKGCPVCMAHCPPCLRATFTLTDVTQANRPKPLEKPAD